MAVTKFCIFCGAPPTGKNKEHVISQWLLRLTGDPNRTVPLGMDYTKPGLPTRHFSYDSFTFPACELCNSSFSALEVRAQRVVMAMLRGMAVSAEDLDTLLDWLDKVRIGLWSGMVYLNKNHLKITPHFFIASRIGAKDRMLLVYRDNQKAHGVSFVGTDSLIFQAMPSCFYFVINHLHFFSVSADWLFSARFGLPSLGTHKFRSDETQEITLAHGTQTVTVPLVDLAIREGASQFYQAIIPRIMLGGDAGSLEGFYDTAYVRGICQNYETGRGKVFQLLGERLEEYPTSPSTQWVPASAYNRHELGGELGLQALDWQDALYMNPRPAMDELSPKTRERIEQQIEGTRSVHARIREIFIEQATRAAKESRSSRNQTGA
jgi:hypothetical protein